MHEEYCWGKKEDQIETEDQGNALWYLFYLCYQRSSLISSVTIT